MNRMFLKGLFLLTAAFSISTAMAATSGDNQWDIYDLKIFKVEGRIIGVADGSRAVAIVCGFVTADIVEPNTRGELNFSGYNATGRTPAVNRAPFRTVTGDAKKKLCDTTNGTVRLAVLGDKVKVLSDVALNSN